MTANNNKRKISDAILYLEGKVRSLSGAVQNIDNNIKLILDRLNHLSDSQSPQLPQPPSPQPSPPQPLSVPSPPQSQENVMVAHPMTEDQSPQPELIEEALPKQQRKERGNRHKGSKVPVSQKILFPDGKSIFLAGVEIFNTQGLLVKQTRTNANGKWVAALDPGEYTIHVVKRPGPESSKPPVELRYQVRVPASSEPLELPPPEGVV